MMIQEEWDESMLLIKVGGGKTINWEGVCADLATIVKKEKVVLVHGANALRDEIAAKLSLPTKTVISPSGISSVYTDSTAIDVFLMAYAGLANKKIVAKLHRCGVNAVGLCGVDGRLWEAKPKKDMLVQEGDKVKLLQGNLTGRVERINTDLLDILLERNFTPVICPPAIGYDHEILNTDGDHALAVMAGALRIKRMISLFEAPGFLEDPDDEKSLISHIDKDRIDEILSMARERMKKKVLGAKRAIEAGVEIIHWGDGRLGHPIRAALEGKGTTIS